VGDVLNKNLPRYWSGFAAGTLFCAFVLARVAVAMGLVGAWLDAPGMVAGFIAWLLTSTEGSDE
jgi:uncharacterized membrane protein